MKKRLFGLLALTLCLIVAAMPVAMADFCYTNDRGKAIQVNSLIFDGNTIYRYGGSGSVYCWPDGYRTEKEQEIFYGERSFSLSYANAATDYWHVAQTDSDRIDVEPTGAEVKIPGNPANIKVFARIFPHVDEDEVIPASDIEAEFQNKAGENTIVVYEVMYLNPVDDVAGVFKSAQPAQPETFYLPKIGGSNVVGVLHWTDDKRSVWVEDVNATGNNVKVTVDHFSPFAVVYGPVNAGAAAPVGDASSSSHPKTGDSAQLALWFTLAGLSAAGMAAIVIRRRKRA